jgi:hypothetical protein
MPLARRRSLPEWIGPPAPLDGASAECIPSGDIELRVMPVYRRCADACARDARRRAAQLRRGVCYECGKARVVPKRTRCVECLAADAARSRARKARQAEERRVALAAAAAHVELARMRTIAVLEAASARVAEDAPAPAADALAGVPTLELDGG